MAGPWIADRRIVLAPDRSRVLTPDEDQTGIQLAAPGTQVSDADCQRYGLGPYAETEKRGPSRSAKAKAED